MMTRIIQMDIVQLNIGSNPCTTPKHLCYFSYLHSHHCPFHFFYHFYLVIKAPSHYKASRAIGLDPDSRGLQCKYTKPWDERAHSHSRTGVHYTTLPLPFAFAFQYPQYINHFPFVSSLCQSESQHTSSTSSPKTLTKKKKPKPTLTTTELNPTSLSHPLTRILNSDPNGGEFFGFSRFHCRVGIHPVHQDPGPDLPPWTPTGSWQSRFVTDSKTLLPNSNSMKC